MNYFQMVNDAIDYIETNLNGEISIPDLAARYYISKFYFTRIFKALTKQNVKEYIDGRRMAVAAGELRTTPSRIIDIAFDCGFESHEAFTRKFKAAFGITPAQYRKDPCKLKLIQPIRVVERQFKNLHREMIVNFHIENPGPLKLVGKHIRLNPDNADDLKKVTVFINQFIADYILRNALDRLYNVTGSEALEDGTLDYFAGVQPMAEGLSNELSELTIVASDYAVFRYKNNMGGIHRIVASDVWKAILLSGLNLNPIGIHFFEIYQRGYNQTNQFLLYVPVEK